MKTSKRLSSLTGYAFAEIDNKVKDLRSEGISPIDFGVGDPTEPTPEIVRKALSDGANRHASGGYPNYTGSDEYRTAIAHWTKKRFDLDLNPATEICASVGSKEAVFNFPEAIIDPDDFVIVPNPGYPPYARGTLFAEGRVHYANLLPENNFLPDLGSIPADVCKKAKLMWINYPNNPTGVTAPASFFEEIIAFGKENDILIASDEAYSENYYGKNRPRSILEFTKTGVVAFNSLSKRSCMTGYRVGWVSGDREVVAAFKKLKTNIDSGTPTFIQDAAVAALSDEVHVLELRNLYRKKRDIMVDAFGKAGLARCCPDATLYIWQKIPNGFTSVDFAGKLLDPQIAIVTTPGSWIGENTPEGNPGEGFIRLALVPSVEECELAAKRIEKFLSGTCTTCQK